MDKKFALCGYNDSEGRGRAGTRALPIGRVVVYFYVVVKGTRGHPIGV